MLYIKIKKLNFISRKLKKRTKKRNSIALVNMMLSRFTNYNYVRIFLKNQRFKVTLHAFPSLFLEEIGTKIIFSY